MLARLQALSDDHFNCAPRRGRLGDGRHPRTLRQPAEAHHGQRLRRGRARPLISGTAGTPAARPARLGVVEGAASRGPEYGDDPMTKLSDTQAIILSAAAQRPEHIALPLPESLRGGAAAKVVGAMLAKGFPRGGRRRPAQGRARLARDRRRPRRHAGRHPTQASPPSASSPRTRTPRMRARRTRRPRPPAPVTPTDRRPRPRRARRARAPSRPP